MEHHGPIGAADAPTTSKESFTQTVCSWLWAQKGRFSHQVTARSGLRAIHQTRETCTALPTRTDNSLRSDAEGLFSLRQTRSIGRAVPRRQRITCNELFMAMDVTWPSARKRRSSAPPMEFSGNCTPTPCLQIPKWKVSRLETEDS